MPKGASASADNLFRIGQRLVLGLVVAAALAGCVARPVSDFGRARPSFTHDTAMPAVGGVAASIRKEPVSNFNMTDQEREMHNRTWRFVSAPHSKDWLFDSAVELQRTRLTSATDFHFTEERYYNWLRREHYNSSRTRYSTVGRHILADLDTVSGTFAAICAVVEVDRQRQIAASGLPAVGADVRANMAARKTENDWHIDWFVRTLNYRYLSYSYALDHLLVETPHEQSMGVNENLRKLKPWVDRANRHDFCGDGGRGPNGGQSVTRPSRYQNMAIDRENIVQK
jgi:hypothetical protein